MIVWAILACEHQPVGGFDSHTGLPEDSVVPEVTDDSVPTESEPPPDSGTPPDSGDSAPDSDLKGNRRATAAVYEHLPVLIIDTHGGTIRTARRSIVRRWRSSVTTTARSPISGRRRLTGRQHRHRAPAQASSAL